MTKPRREEEQVGARTIVVSNREKVLFPGEGITKGEVVDYYHRVAETMLPHLRGRPLTLERFPDGLAAEGFLQKEASGHFPDWIARVTVDKEGGTITHVLAEEPATLVYLADQATVAFHVWLSRADRPRHPDRMVFDLDPPQGPEAARRAAGLVRRALEETGLRSFPMATGSRGFHVTVPLDRGAEVSEVRRFAADLAGLLARRHPERLTVAVRRSRREGRVFLDFLRNGYAQTVVAPYSLRARPGAPVATPLDWEELAGIDPRRYTLHNLFRRLGQKPDPWAELDRHAQSLGAARRVLDELLEDGS